MEPFHLPDEEAEPLQRSSSALALVLVGKDRLIDNLTREKHQLSCDLKKQKRTCDNLKQQLEDERYYYFKEKEHFCEQLNSQKCCGGHQQQQQQQQQGLAHQVNELAEENAQLRAEVSRVLQVNCNLAEKFLRMRNTKNHLKEQMKQLENALNNEIAYLKKELHDSRVEINYITSEKFNLPISPSNKKYLQVVKNHSQICYDNVCLQTRVRKLEESLQKAKDKKSSKQKDKGQPESPKDMFAGLEDVAISLSQLEIINVASKSDEIKYYLPRNPASTDKS